MLFIAKLNCISGIAIGAYTVMIVKQVRKNRRKQKGTRETSKTWNRQHWPYFTHVIHRQALMTIFEASKDN